jgi:hypothetical protein
MNWPPSLLRIRIRNNNIRFSLWLPLFLIRPFFLLAMVILSPLIILCAVLMWPLGLSKPLLLTGPILFRLLCSMRGLEIAVENSSDQVLISFR